MSEALARTPLYARHVEAGGRMVPFAGFEMPVLYSGIVDEHRAVRTQAGLFDVSHMGEIRLRGPGALGLAQLLLTNDVTGMAAGQVRYGLLCQEDGGVIDDVTLYRRSDEDLFFCVNASNIQADLAWMQECQKKSQLACEVLDESAQTALLAIQGPLARRIVLELQAQGAPSPRRWRFAPDELVLLPFVPGDPPQVVPIEDARATVVEKRC